MAPIYLKTFGEFQIMHNGELVNKLFKSEKIRALLLILISSPNGVTREKLMGLLWPDSPDKSARQNLRQSLYTIRKTLIHLGHLEFSWTADQEFIQPLKTDGIWDGDFLAIERAIGEIKSHKHQNLSACPECINKIEGALNLYSDTFLSGYAVDSLEFEYWVQAKQDYYKKTALAWLQILESWYASRLDFSSAAQAASTRFEILEKIDEKLLRDILWLHHLSLNHEAALSEFKSFSSKIRHEFNLEPEQSTCALAEDVRKFSLPRPHNLYASATPFVGRQDELNIILSNIRKGERVISLVAPGGTGKTRLALQAGIRLLYEQKRHVFALQVSNLSPSETLEYALGNVLQMNFSLRPSLLEQIAAQLRAIKSPVLILDGCENMLEVCARFILDILELCPDTTFIVTSQASMKFEKINPTSLPLSNYDKSPSLGSMNLSVKQLPLRNSVEFFIIKSDASLGKFNVDNLTAPLIAELCENLQGLPLAIEIVCGQCVKLPIDEIHKQIMDVTKDFADQNISRIMEDILMWGYGLLDSEEKDVLQQLSLFATGGKKDALINLVGDRKIKVLDSLLKKHWITFDDTCQYQMQDTIREFSRYHLVNSNNEEGAAIRYVNYYKNFTAELAPKLSTAQVKNSLEELRQEKNNIEAAIEYSLRFGDNDSQHYLVGNLAIFWGLTGYFREGQDWYQRILTGEAAPGAQVSSFSGFGMLSMMMGDIKLAREYLEKAFSLTDKQDNSEQKLRIWLNLSAAYARLNLPELAHVNFQNLIETAREAGQRNILAVATMNYANFQMSSGAMQNLDRIESLYLEGLGIIQESGDLIKLASIFNNLGVIKRQKTDYVGAIAMYKKSLDVREKLGDRVGMISTYSNLGLAQAQLKRFKDSFSSFCKGLKLILDIEKPHTNPGFLGNFARSLMFAKKWEEAAIIMGASQAVFDTIGHISDKDKQERDIWLNDLKQKLEPAQLSSLWEEGYQAKGLDAINLSLSVLDSLKVK
jgi:DNA-binding SARP family transcriptional activator/tetratricopeptide (TPR) repeat protein